MRSRIFSGLMHHHRFEKTKHSFSYPVFYFAFDLDELETLTKSVKGFSYNKRNCVSLKQSDHIYGKGTIKTEALKLLQNQNLNTSDVSKIELITMPRFLGYAFNPVNFYFFRNQQDRLIYFIAEVNNTFGERHFYIANQFTQEGDFLITNSKKCFHVSPFFDREGEYEFRFSENSQDLFLDIRLKKLKKTVFFASLRGKPKAFNTKNLIKTYLRFPLATFLTLPRISWQAFKLYFYKRLNVMKKPPLKSNLSLQTKKTTGLSKICKKILFNQFQKIKTGSLKLILPTREEIIFNKKDPSKSFEITIHDNDFFKKSVFNADIGFAESYINQDWTTPQLTNLLQFFIQNQKNLKPRQNFLSFFKQIANRFRHFLNKNSLFQSQKNIQAHYDLSNDFYKLFLDPTMTYSSGYFKTPFEDLKTSQKNKIQMLFEKLNIKPNDSILEIGSGWGTLAIEMAKQFDCKIKSITLSKEQLDYAKKRAKAEKVDHKIEFEFCDYRSVTGQFDKIVSIEMIEAVGHKYHESFFKSLDRLLKPHGQILIQAITIPDSKYKSYRKSCDFIQKHIFPGGLLPSLNRLSEVMTKQTDFFVEHLENIGIHYAQTLKLWNENFLRNKDQIQKLGFNEKFIRKWHYYLSYCEAGFRERILNTIQIVITRPQNKNLPTPFSKSKLSPIEREIA